jgi:hypothetical protein
LDGAGTLTEEDATGEGIPQLHERVLKWVGSGSAGKIYQAIDGDEPLLDLGVTEISVGVWVYQGASGSGVIKLDIGRESGGFTTLGFDTTTVTEAWTLLKVEGVTVPADTAGFRFRIYIANNSGTFYAAMPMLNVGPRVRAWQPRRLRLFEPSHGGGPLLVNVDPPDTDWHDVSLSSIPAMPVELKRAVRVQLLVDYRNHVGSGSTVSLRRKGRTTVNGSVMVVRNSSQLVGFLGRAEIMVDDTGAFQYQSSGGANTETLSIYYDSAWIWE